jgi:cytochrome c1
MSACGSSPTGNALRDQQLPAQIANENYTRLSTTTPEPRTHPLPDQLTPVPGVAGDPNAGRALFLARGCGGCHTILSLSGADGVAGPRLDNTVLRGTIAGNQIPATPQSLALWIYDPASLKADTTMPKPGVSEAEARDIAAFLYSLPENVGE